MKRDENSVHIGWLRVWVLSMRLYQEDEISLLWGIMQLRSDRVSWKIAKRKMKVSFLSMLKNQPLFNFLKIIQLSKNSKSFTIDLIGKLVDSGKVLWILELYFKSYEFFKLAVLFWCKIQTLFQFLGIIMFEDNSETFYWRFSIICFNLPQICMSFGGIY